MLKAYEIEYYVRARARNRIYYIILHKSIKIKVNCLIYKLVVIKFFLESKNTVLDEKNKLNLISKLRVIRILKIKIKTGAHQR